jgi:hypothetical protein
MTKEEAARTLSDPNATEAQKSEAGKTLSDSEKTDPHYTRNAGKDWSDADCEQLKQLAAENTPTRVIGFKLGRTEDAIYSKAAELGVSLAPPNQPG